MPAPMELDTVAIVRWLDPLARRPEEIAEVFAERRRSVAVDWVDGRPRETRICSTDGISARWRRGPRQSLASVSRCDDEAARDAIRAVQTDAGISPIPIRPLAPRPPRPLEPGVASERWTRRLAAVLARHTPRHRLRWTLTEIERRVIPARGPGGASSRRLLSLEGTFTAASRRGDEVRKFSFHAPLADSTADELKSAIARAAEPRESATPCGEGETDAVLAAGCAAVLFHEILSHPLEAGVESPLSRLEQARLAVPEVEVRDEPTRLDLFGGYEVDDEGMPPRPVKFLDAGRLAGRMTDRSHGPGPSNGHGRRAGAEDAPLPRGSNVVVSPGHATSDEMTRRLQTGLIIEEFDGGSVELASGKFRLRFPRARRVRRGRLADECGDGFLSGEILAVLASIDSALGRDQHPYRALGWCARGGQVVPVQGAAPDVLVRRVRVRPIS
jgi:predicted Zn-dependent protease